MLIDGSNPSLCINMFDIIGELCILNSEESAPKILPTRVRAVWRKMSPVLTKERIHQYELVKGEQIRETCVTEAGLKIFVSLDVYFNTRYATERARVKSFFKGENLLIIGAGCGVSSLYLSDNFKFICNSEINPRCVELFMKNLEANKIYNSSLLLVPGEKILKSKKAQFSNFLIIMPLNEVETLKFLDLIIHSDLRRKVKSSILFYLKRSNSDGLHDIEQKAEMNKYSMKTHRVKPYSKFDDIYAIYFQ